MLRSPHSKSQVNMAPPALSARAEDNPRQIGKEKDKITTPPGGSLLTVGVMGWEATVGHVLKRRSKATRPIPRQAQGWQEIPLVFHMAYDG